VYKVSCILYVIPSMRKISWEVWFDLPTVLAGCREGDPEDEAMYTQWFAVYTIANFTQIALNYQGQAVEVQASSMFSGAPSCKGLMEWGSSNAITCPQGLPLGTFSMPLDGSTRFVRNLGWSMIGQQVLMFGGMNRRGQIIKVGASRTIARLAAHLNTQNKASFAFTFPAHSTTDS
jgi:hypothetical protein